MRAMRCVRFQTMRSVRGIPLAVVLLMLLAALAAACSRGAAGGGTVSFRDRLELLPASVIDDPNTNVVVAMADLDQAAQLAGVERPADASDVDAVLDYVNAVTGIPGSDAGGPASVAALTPQAAHVDRLVQVNEFEDELGWSIADVSWFAEAQVAPNTLMVAGGDFDEARLSDAMGDRQDGMWRLGGEDGEVNIEEVSAARPIGESLRLALDDGRLIVGRSTPPVEEALDGGAPTLADNEVLRSLAQAMDDHDAYSALFTAGAQGADPASFLFGDPDASVEDVEEQFAEVQNQVLPQPFLGVAGGVTSVDGEPIVLFAYVHPNAETAQANADALRRIVEQGQSLQSEQPWSNLFTVDDISADGSTVVARLGLGERGNPQLPYNILMTRDSLVSHR